jgi:hypothetical protein
MRNRFASLCFLIIAWIIAVPTCAPADTISACA